MNIWTKFVSDVEIDNQAAMVEIMAPHNRGDHNILKIATWVCLNQIWKTMQCCYNVVNFLQTPHKIHPIAYLLGRDMRCLLCTQRLINIWPQWLFTVMFAISWYFGLRFNGTQLYVICQTIPNFIITVTSHECHGILNHQQLSCLLNILFMLLAIKTWNLHITGIFENHWWRTAGFPSQWASDVESISMTWCYHVN